MNQIEKTTDYSKFSFTKYNREIKEDHLDKLIRSIDEQNLLHSVPIIVNENYEIIDGQHRFKAAEHLEKPIYYVVTDEECTKTMINLNSSSRRWTVGDYVHFWACHGKQDYIDFLKFMEEWGLPPSTSTIWINAAADLKPWKEIKDGTFDFDLSEEEKEALHCTFRFLDEIDRKQKNKRRFMKNKVFHMACKHFFMSENIDPEEFFEKFKNSGEQIINFQTVSDMIYLFLRIYNKYKKNKVLLVSTSYSYKIVHESDVV